MRSPGSATDQPTIETSLSPYRDGILYRDFLQPVLIAGVVTALLAGPITFLQTYAPGGPWIYLATIVFLIALEGVYTTRWLAHSAQRQVNHLAYRAAELIIILLVLRLFTWLVGGGLPTATELRGYLISPISFIDPLFFLYLIFAFLALDRGIGIGRIFTRLDLSNDEIAYYTLPAHARELIQNEKPPLTDRAEVMQNFFHQWIVGGAFLGLFAVLTSFDLSAAAAVGYDLRTVNQIGLRPQMLMALLGYFLIGLWLTSHARLAVMRARWLANGVITSEGVAHTWHRTSLILLLLIATAAAFLPIGSTFAIGRILEAIVVVGVTILNFMVGLAIVIAYLFLALLFGRQVIPDETEAEPPPPAATPEMPPTIVGDDASLVIGGLFWLVIIIVTFTALVFFLRDRGYPLNTTFIPLLWQTLTRWLRRLWGGLAGTVERVGQTVWTRLRLVRASKPGQLPWRFIRLGALSPRDQIRYFYLSTVRRASERGVARDESETPLEYARDLEETWPDADADIEELTHAFLKARYSAQEIEKDEVNLVKRTWKRVRAALRRHSERS